MQNDKGELAKKRNGAVLQEDAIRSKGVRLGETPYF